MKFTEQAIIRIKPTNQQVEYRDDITKGLILRVGTSGQKSWQVRYRSDGKQYRQSIGKFPTVSLKDARNKARTIQAAVIDGENPIIEQRREKLKKEVIRSAMSIEKLVEDYYALHLKSLRTGDQAMSFLREFREQFAFLDINDFTKHHFSSLLDGIMRAGNGTKANRVHSHVKTFCNWCIGKGYLEYNPCDRIKKPYKEQPCERFLSDQEIVWFWKATEADLEPWGYLARLLLLTGQRLNECAKMTDNELLEPDHWHMSGDRTKNKRQHDVFLASQAQAIVRRNNRIASPSGLVFTTNGSSFLQSFDKPIKRLRKRMDEISGQNIPYFTFHDLRRTCETGLAKLGTSQDLIDRVVNHTTGRGMARVYNMYDYRNEKAAALQKWADHVEGLVS